ncbi:DUF2147 domain-containing protein [Helicobacter saguini]|uniref:DUF2147 domain-containing protein n=1 Tax=Helicobacter saguini TaxID=1548018 RepID=A0A347VNF0_9HELI|nr:DUF2147 domain-containing protein [Helicobacter saguini]MWV61794.1 DUF2147 domain-containing protein [Helicobacter saguini]MWV67531.1 DUF2147 domain-containing protein [Helicobacter saguini]MWV69883.1 DUF2147 domain-containing protein [Helicobacter saguini]MWV72900.1 DUF2147 domain-containing protein [Helicobacter saguini]TLD93254.1 DUF2147 domain-containing protein [Helicobacter saguini]
MKKLKFLALLLALNVAFAVDISGVYALTFGETESYVEVFKKNNKYYAVGFANKDGSEGGKDVNNPDPKLRDRNLHRVVFMWNLVEEKENKFEDGTIYNHKDGKLYHASAKLDGNILKVVASKDSAGIFGKTLKWRKLNANELSAIADKRIDVNTLDIPK